MDVPAVCVIVKRYCNAISDRFARPRVSDQHLKVTQGAPQHSGEATRKQEGGNRMCALRAGLELDLGTGNCENVARHFCNVVHVWEGRESGPTREGCANRSEIALQ